MYFLPLYPLKRKLTSPAFTLKFLNPSSASKLNSSLLVGNCMFCERLLRTLTTATWTDRSIAIQHFPRFRHEHDNGVIPPSCLSDATFQHQTSTFMANTLNCWYHYLPVKMKLVWVFVQMQNYGHSARSFSVRLRVVFSSPSSAVRVLRVSNEV